MKEARRKAKFQRLAEPVCSFLFHVLAPPSLISIMYISQKMTEMDKIKEMAGARGYSEIHVAGEFE